MHLWTESLMEGCVGALSCVTVSCYLRHGAAQEIETISAGSWNTSKTEFIMFKDFYDWILMLWWVDKFPSFTWCWEPGTDWFKEEVLAASVSQFIHVLCFLSHYFTSSLNWRSLSYLQVQAPAQISHCIFASFSANKTRAKQTWAFKIEFYWTSLT